MLSDIPAGDGRIANLFLQCTVIRRHRLLKEKNINMIDTQTCLPLVYSEHPSDRWLQEKKLNAGMYDLYSTYMQYAVYA